MLIPHPPPISLYASESPACHIPLSMLFQSRVCANHWVSSTLCPSRTHARRAPRGQHGTINRVQEQVLHGGGAFLCCPPTQPLSHLQYSWCTLERVLKSLLLTHQVDKVYRVALPVPDENLSINKLFRDYVLLRIYNR